MKAQLSCRQPVVLAEAFSAGRNGQAGSVTSRRIRPRKVALCGQGRVFAATTVHRRTWQIRFPPTPGISSLRIPGVCVEGAGGLSSAPPAPKAPDVCSSLMSVLALPKVTPRSETAAGAPSKAVLKSTWANTHVTARLRRTSKGAQGVLLTPESREKPHASGPRVLGRKRVDAPRPPQRKPSAPRTLSVCADTRPGPAGSPWTDAPLRPATPTPEARGVSRPQPQH